jgi:hypothetical protein
MFKEGQIFSLFSLGLVGRLSQLDINLLCELISQKLRWKGIAFIFIKYGRYPLRNETLVEILVGL